MKQKNFWVFLGSLFLSTAVMAESAPAGADLMGPGGLSQFALIGAFILIFYVFFIRPQTKKAKEHQQLIGGLQKGDEVITTGGFLGKITKVTDTFLVMSIAEGVEVSIQRNAILSCVPKGTLKSIV